MKQQVKAGQILEAAVKQQVKAGQVWGRRNGALITIERIAPAGTHEGFAEYWLSAGSKPQFRQIRIDRLRRTCVLLA